MSTTQEPDFAAIAQRIATEAMPFDNYRYVGSLGMAARTTYAICTATKLRQDWETIRLLRESKAIHLRDHPDEENDPSEYFADLSSHLSNLEAQFQ
jgi:hypothetical protein